MTFRICLVKIPKTAPQVWGQSQVSAQALSALGFSPSPVPPHGAPHRFNTAIQCPPRVRRLRLPSRLSHPLPSGHVFQAMCNHPVGCARTHGKLSTWTGLLKLFSCVEGKASNSPHLPFVQKQKGASFSRPFTAIRGNCHTATNPPQGLGSEWHLLGHVVSSSARPCNCPWWSSLKPSPTSWTYPDCGYNKNNNTPGHSTVSFQNPSYSFSPWLSANPRGIQELQGTSFIPWSQNDGHRVGRFLRGQWSPIHRPSLPGRHLHIHMGVKDSQLNKLLYIDAYTSV